MLRYKEDIAVGTRAAAMLRYKEDIAAGQEWLERLYSHLKPVSKRWKPTRTVFLVGNHETPRIEAVCDQFPSLTDAISERDFDILRWFGTKVGYAGKTPGIEEIDGI